MSDTRTACDAGRTGRREIAARVAPLVAPACLAALFARALWPWAESGTDEIRRTAAAHLAALDGADDAPYLRDRARAVVGQVLDGKGLPIPATVAMADAGELAERASAIAGLAGALDLAPRVEATASTGRDGAFAFAAARLGSKLLFFTAEGHAPARRTDVLVQDGVRITGQGVTLKPARSLAVDCRERAGFGRYRPIYAGWWPDTGWQDLDDHVDLAWRSPDGFPVALALLPCPNAAEVALRALPPDRTAPLRLEDLPPWSPPTTCIPGTPELAVSVPHALALASGLARLTPPLARTDAGAIVAVKADAGFARVTLTLEGGTRHAMFADAFGEAVLFGVPDGLHTVTTSILGGGTTWAKGVAALQGRVRKVSLWRGDVRPEDEQSIHGFLRDAAGRPLAGDVFCQAFWPGGRQVLADQADQHGFFRFRGLQRAVTYTLIGCTGDTPEHCRHAVTVAMPAGNGGVELRQDLTLPRTRVAVNLPPPARGADTLVLHALRDPAPRGWRIPVAGRPKLTLHDVSPGAWRCELWQGERCLAEVARLDVAALSPEAAVPQSAWAAPSEEARR